MPRTICAPAYAQFGTAELVITHFNDLTALRADLVATRAEIDRQRDYIAGLVCES